MPTDDNLNREAIDRAFARLAEAEVRQDNNRRIREYLQLMQNDFATRNMITHPNAARMVQKSPEASTKYDKMLEEVLKF